MLCRHGERGVVEGKPFMKPDSQAVGMYGVLIVLLVGTVLYMGSYPRIRPFRQDPAQEQYARQAGLPLAVTNSLGMVFRLIPSGIYQRGSPPTERGRRPDEYMHPVRISTPFYMAATLVTQEQFEEVMGYNPSFFDGRARLPVEFVSWEESLLFCNALSRREGREEVYVYEQEDGRWRFHPDRSGYRLPTEAEWEFACRAGTDTPFYTGPTSPMPMSRDTVWRAAWHRHNARGSTHPVAQREPNTWGLYDMLGNVWEWCWDWYAPYPRRLDPPPTGPRRGTQRVIRGGGWYSPTHETRSASRMGRDPALPWNSLGFRVVLPVAAAETQGE